MSHASEGSSAHKCVDTGRRWGRVWNWSARHSPSWHRRTVGAQRTFVEGTSYSFLWRGAGQEAARLGRPCSWAASATSVTERSHSLGSVRHQCGASREGRGASRGASGETLLLQSRVDTELRHGAKAVSGKPRSCVWAWATGREQALRWGLLGRCTENPEPRTPPAGRLLRGPQRDPVVSTLGCAPQTDRGRVKSRGSRP